MNPEWDEAAYDSLADVWVVATPEERETVEAAVHELNRLLQDHPERVGESRVGNIRVTFVGPLTEYFRAVAGETARVLHVRMTRSRK